MRVRNFSTLSSSMDMRSVSDLSTLAVSLFSNWACVCLSTKRTTHHRTPHFPRVLQALHRRHLQTTEHFHDAIKVVERQTSLCTVEIKPQTKAATPTNRCNEDKASNQQRAILGRVGGDNFGRHPTTHVVETKNNFANGASPRGTAPLVQFRAPKKTNKHKNKKKKQQHAVSLTKMPHVPAASFDAPTRPGAYQRMTCRCCDTTC